MATHINVNHIHDDVDGNIQAKNTFFRFGGKQHSITVRASPNRYTIRNRLVATTPLYDESTFVGAPAGVYTFLVGDRGFFAVNVRSWLEIGTVHRVLARRSGTTRVFMAGEMRKHAKTVEFNLMSGTFTLAILSTYKVAEERAAVEASMKERVHDFLRHMGLDAVEVPTTFITEESMPATEPVLREYRNVGFRILCYGGDFNTVKEGKMKAQLVQKMNVFKKFPSDKLASEIAVLERELAAMAACKATATEVEFKGGRRTTRRRLR